MNRGFHTILSSFSRGALHREGPWPHGPRAQRPMNRIPWTGTVQGRPAPLPTRGRSRFRSLIRLVVPIPLCTAVLLLASGCIELETRIKLNRDGSVVVTERFRILRPLREIEAGAGKDVATTFEKLLSRERAMERAKEMGKGAVLTSHVVRDAHAGSREAVTVYTVPQFTDLTYCSPFFQRGDRQGKLRVAIHPQYKNSWNQVAGILFLHFDHRDLKGEKSELFKELTRTSESPVIRQGYRDIAPIFRDAMKGLKIRIIFENYGQILGTGGMAKHLFPYKRPKQVNIINYAYGDETGGRTGTHPLDEEEVATDLVKLLLGHPDDRHSPRPGQFLGKRTGRSSFRAVIRPSEFYFDKYFKGKDLHFGGSRGTKKASFADIGDKGWKGKNGKK